MGFSIAYSFEHYVMGHDYSENWFELDAERAEKNLISFKVFDWNLKKLVEINPP